MKKRITLFDSLRGLAMIGIFMVHNINMQSVFKDGGFWRDFFSNGNLGVEITYLIAAYFFTIGFKKKSCSIFAYYAKLFARILPLYWVAMFANWWIHYHWSIDFDYSLPHFFAHMFLLNGFSPKCFNSIFLGSGYLGILMIMWILSGAVNSFVRNKEQAFVTTVVSYVVTWSISRHLVLYSTVALNQPYIIDWFNYLARGINSFSLGILLYYILKEEYEFNRGLVWLVSLASIFYIGVGMYSNQISSEVFLIFVAIIIIVNYKKGIWIIDNVIFRTIGYFSFEIYITHVFLYNILGYFMERELKMFVFMLVFTIFNSLLFHYALCKPVSKIVLKMLTNKQ